MSDPCKKYARPLGASFSATDQKNAAHKLQGVELFQLLGSIIRVRSFTKEPVCIETCLYDYKKTEITCVDYESNVGKFVYRFALINEISGQYKWLVNCNTRPVKSQ